MAFLKMYNNKQLKWECAFHFFMVISFHVWMQQTLASVFFVLLYKRKPLNDISSVLLVASVFACCLLWFSAFIITTASLVLAIHPSNPWRLICTIVRALSKAHWSFWLLSRVRGSLLIPCWVDENSYQSFHLHCQCTASPPSLDWIIHAAHVDL